MDDRIHRTPTRLLTRVALVGLAALFALAAASNALARPSAGTSTAASNVVATAQAEETDEVLLPSRVANAIKHTQTALANAAEHLDEGEYKQVVTSLRAVKNNMYRADRAARVQMNAVAPDPEGEEGTAPVTTPADSVVAVLTLDQQIVTSLVGLFDTHSQTVVISLTHTMFQTMSARDELLATVTGLDPEGAGADYADAMADTLDGYTDEVANLQEALAGDTLSAGGRRVLTAALAKSQATLATITAVFGGGE